MSEQEKKPIDDPCDPVAHWFPIKESPPKKEHEDD